MQGHQKEVPAPSLFKKKPFQTVDLNMVANTKVKTKKTTSAENQSKKKKPK
jgi:hypothetical protein